MKTSKIVFFILFLVSFSIKAYSQSTTIVYLSGKDAENTVEWDFYCTAGNKSGFWTKIPVPSCWESKGFGSYDYGRNNPLKNRLNEEGYYKHNFFVETTWKNKQINLVFDGVMTDCEVKINGKKAGEIHQGAFYQFKYQVEQLLKYGKTNLLEVHVSKNSANKSVNEAERVADYWVFGGVYRPVYLEVNPKNNIQRVAVDAKANGQFLAEVYLSKNISNGLIRIDIIDKNGKTAAQFNKTINEGSKNIVVSGECKNPELWTPETPNLYSVRFSLLNNKNELLHYYDERIGFRTIEVREQDGIYVNNVRIKFKGVNRHTFHPNLGRATTKELSIRDVNIIKDMNMNAVRMSHYPPEKHFLDVCDSLGLFVLNELSGWQTPPYDSTIGRKLLEEMIIHDVNHPSIVLWDNGNEGGWNKSYDSFFKKLDIQKREVLHPWAVFEKTNTAHYIDYNYLSLDNFAPRKIFFPTEFLHGLYDGGHGAGLEDYWNLMYLNPLCAGGFLWSYADECLYRSDLNCLDCQGNQAPDGILGPYLEKEGSFFTIREIWSPVYFENKYITSGFDGNFNIENRYHYTNLNQCKFTYEWLEVHYSGNSPETNTLFSGDINTGSIPPNQKGSINIKLSDNWENADILVIKAHDPFGRLIHTWTWPVKSAKEFYNVNKPRPIISNVVEFSETNEKIILDQGQVILEINKLDGTLNKIRNKTITIPLSAGPVLCANTPKLTEIEHKKSENGYVVIAKYEKNNFEVRWELLNNGLVNLDVKYHPTESKPLFAGISFNYPEEKISKVKYIGDGPYRVWKNRMRGPAFGIWDKTYNESYPEFKGYYSNIYWVKFESKSGNNFSVFSKTDDLFIRLFSPDNREDPAKTAVANPTGDISFLNGIPAIGTKFSGPEQLGPHSQPYSYVPKRVENEKLSISLTFNFNLEK